MTIWKQLWNCWLRIQDSPNWNFWLVNFFKRKSILKHSFDRKRLLHMTHHIGDVFPYSQSISEVIGCLIWLMGCTRMPHGGLSPRHMLLGPLCQGNKRLGGRCSMILPQYWPASFIYTCQPSLYWPCIRREHEGIVLLNGTTKIP